MAPEYQLKVYDTAGALQAIVIDYHWLNYSKRVNEPGLLRFQLPDGHAAMSYLALANGLIEVWRRNITAGYDWYLDFTAINRSQEFKTPGETLGVYGAPGVLWLLGTRHVGFYAGTANRTEFASQKSESILKKLVDYNIGANALASNGRVRDGVSSGKWGGIYTIANQADAATGNSKAWSCAWKNLLTTCQDLVSAGAGGDFDLVKTAATTLEFRFYAGQLGTDRTASLVFALNRGNMAEPDWKFDRTTEKTVAIVAGQGEQADRVLVTRTGADFATANDIETFVDARSYSTIGALQADGDQALYNLRARQQFTFKALQAPNATYGKDYFLGDLVTAVYRTATTTQKVVGVTVSHDITNGEKIDTEMAQQ
jgi:hypothetical protein